MKKLQAFFAVLSVVAGISGALAFTPKTDLACSGTHLYYKPTGGTTYELIDPSGSSAGEEGNCLYFDVGVGSVPRYQPCTNTLFNIGAVAAIAVQ